METFGPMNGKQNTQNRGRRWSPLAAIAAFAIALMAGCGGGGGGGGGNTGNGITVIGSIMDATTYSAPANATITFGGLQVKAGADGTFSATVPASVKSASVSATGEVTRTISISLVSNQVNNLGSIFLAPTGFDYSANITGRVVTSIKGVTQPVGNATVTIGNVTVQSATDGTFTLTGLPVGLGSVNGLYGKITAKGFADKLISADTLGYALVSGANNIGDLLIAQPSGSTPLPPYTITGNITVAGVPVAGVSVQIAVQGAGTGIGQTVTDSSGNYYFWVAPAAYTVQATDNSGTTMSEGVTLTSTTTPVTAATMNLSP
jgi:hypothetical protein